MNKVILMGRIVRDPEVRYTSSNNAMAIARYTLAVNRKFVKDGEQSADFISCVAFGKAGEFAEKYYRQGTKVLITGRIQTGSYTNKDGQKVYTTDVVVEEQEFAESKASGGNSGNGTNGSGNGQNTNSGRQNQSYQSQNPMNNGFMNIPDGIDEELPFN